MVLAEKVRGFGGMVSIIIVCVLYNIIQLFFLPVNWIAGIGAYRKCSELGARLFTGFMTCLMEGMPSTQMRFYGDQSFWEVEQPTALLISNHIAFSDWLILYFMAIRRGAHGCARWIVKEAVCKIPLIGWAMRAHEFIPLAKRSAADLGSVTTALKSFADAKSRLWLALYPEGTFIDDDNRDTAIPAALKFCQDNGLAPLHHLLVPRYKGLATALAVMRPHLTHVVDCTIVCTGTRSATGKPFDTCMPLHLKERLIPDIPDFLSHRGPDTVHLHLRMIPIAQVPTADAELKAWLYERWAEKERLLVHFGEHHEFPGAGWAMPLNQWRLAQYLYFWAIWGGCVVWAFTFVPAIFWKVLAFAGPVAAFVIFQIYQRQQRKMD